MAYKRKVNKGESPKLDMTPMIDVVFQLLIFFVVTLKQEDILAKLSAARPAPNQDEKVKEQQQDLINVIVAPTEAQALAKRDEYLSYASAEAGVAHFSSCTGIDFAVYVLDEPIQYVKSNAIQSATKVLQNNDWTRRKLLEQPAQRGLCRRAKHRGHAVVLHQLADGRDTRN